VGPLVTSGTSVPSHSRQCLQRIQGHHSLRFDHLVHSRNHQVTLPSKPTPPQLEPLRCYTCNKIGHISRDCRSKSTAAMEFQGYYESPLQQDYFQQLEYPHSQNYPHFSESDDMEERAPEEVAAAATYRPPRSSYGTRPPSGPAKTTTASPSKPRSPPPPEFRPPAPTHAPSQDVCWQHNIVRCDRCLRLSTPATHHCQALVAVCQDCGQQHPVIADACQSRCRNTNMPVADGLLEKQPVGVLRDTGCSTVVVRRSLIPKENLTGQEERCVLIDGTVRRTPVAQFCSDTPYFSGTTTAVCMKNPLYDVTIGNIPGATDPTTSHPASAVQTRSQVKATKGQSPQITPLIDLGSEDVTILQEEDSTLQRAMTAAKDKSDPQFQVQRGFLYRVKVNKQGQTTKQTPSPLDFANAS